MGAGEWIALVGLILTMAGIVLSVLKHREESLRRREVHAWADEAIDALQTLRVLAGPAARDKGKDGLIEAQMRLSALVDRGRLFFRNEPYRLPDGTYFGGDNPPAYAGLRPRILDPLVAAHDAAVILERYQESDRDLTEKAIVACIRDFVSLAQDEVGRTKSASMLAGEPGFGEPFDRYRAQIVQSKDT